MLPFGSFSCYSSVSSPAFICVCVCVHCSNKYKPNPPPSHNGLRCLGFMVVKILPRQIIVTDSKNVVALTNKVATK